MVVLFEGFLVKCCIGKANTAVSRKPDVWNRSNNQNSTELLEVTVPLACSHFRGRLKLYSVPKLIVSIQI